MRFSADEECAANEIVANFFSCSAALKGQRSSEKCGWGEIRRADLKCKSTDNRLYRINQRK